MLDKNKAADIFGKIKKYSTADEVEALIYGGHSALTRFANNTIHQNVAEENYVVSVRTAFDGRTARATTNKLDDESLKRVVQASEKLAKVQHPDLDLLPMPEAGGGARCTQTQPVPSRYFDETAAITPEQRAEAVKKIVGVAQKHRLTTAGIFSTSEVVEGIFNSRGLADWYRQTSSEVSVTMLAADSSGWQKANSPNVAHLDAVTLAEIAARKAFESAGGLAILDQRSFLNNRVGTKLFGENINIWDDVGHALQSGAPFDGEGIRRQRVQLVEDGVVKRLVYARATAEKMKKSEYKDKVGQIEPTGHGFPIPNEMGEAPMNIVFGGTREPKTVDQMIGSTERGILVTRLWYIREVDPYEKITFVSTKA